MKLVMERSVSLFRTRGALILYLMLGGSLAVASTLTVTSTSDSGTGSLREAIANAIPGDTITFNLTYPATITLASTITIGTSLTISGPGAANLAISGNTPSFSFPVLLIDPSVTAAISGVTIENGSGTPSGGIINQGGTLTLNNCTITGNSGAHGGGIFNTVGTLTLVNSTVSGNSAGFGGGIYNDSGQVTLISSTLSGNSATQDGGGIYQQGLEWLTLTNSTVSGNSAAGVGGGLYNAGSLALGNTTISGNSAANGGGIFQDLGGDLVPQNTIIANSVSGGNCSLTALTKYISGGHNLSDDITCTFLIGPGDLNNTPAGLDPNGLQNNGGPTKTIALLSTSPAVNVIPLSPFNYCTDLNGNPLITDQRGISRPQGPACDIGAVEFQSSGYTATGANVSDQPTDPATGGTPVTLTFSNVTQAGTTSLSTGSAGPPAPTAFKLGNPPVYYDLSTTAVFSGAVTVCVNYAGTTFINPSKIRLFHYENSTWVDITTSVNTATTTVCGSATSFSPFAIFESDYTASVQSPIKADGSSIFAANRGVVPVKFALALEGTATCQLPPATILVTETAGAAPGTVNESDFSTQADSGSNFRIDMANCQYVYNLGVGNLGTGTYLVQIMIEKVAVGSGSFGLN